MINEKDIENLSKLARIELSEKEKKSLAKDVDKILSFVEQVKEAGGGTEVKPEAGVLRNVLREDKDPHQKGEHTKKLLAEAPESEKDYLKVQKIL